MDNNENDTLHAAINTKLGEIAAASSPPPTWHEAWSRLGPESSEPAAQRAAGHAHRGREAAAKPRGS